MRPDAALRRLLDALEQELLDVSEDELRDALPGLSLGLAADAVRGVARAALAGGDASDIAVRLGGAPGGRDGWLPREATDEHTGAPGVGRSVDDRG